MKVYRTELTPVSFLRHSALVFPDEARGRPRRAAVHLPGARGTGRPAGVGAPRARAWRSTTGSRSSARTRRRCWRRTSACRPRAASWSRSTRACRRRRSRTSWSTRVRASSSSTPSSQPVLEPIDLSGARRSRGSTTRACADDPYEAFLAGGSPEPVESWLEDEEETISINYTSGTTGRPKGVMYTHRGAYLNALGEVIETGLTRDSVYLWTLPMFHCNGWCFPWANVAISGDPGLPAQGRTRADLGAVRLRGHHALQRRADRADRRGEPPERAAAAVAGHRHRRRRAAVADAARPDEGAEPSARPRLRTDRDVRPVHRLRVAPGVGRAAVRRAGAAAGPPGSGVRDRGDGAGRRRRTANDVPRDGETMGEVLHARQQRR